jgi:hypothetical protein
VAGEDAAMLFAVPTPMGFAVRTSGEYWKLIEEKHPEVRGKIEQVKRCLQDPLLVRRSKQDPTVYLFYSPQPPYHLAVVAKRLDGEGFVVTSYLTDKIKEGESVWPISE